MMRFIKVRPQGKSYQLYISEGPRPEPNAHEVLIDVEAAGVNRADILQARGFYPPPKNASPILGLECSGVVSKLGQGVKKFKVGDKVMALLPGGAYSESVAVEATHCIPVPKAITMAEAAGIMETLCTTYLNLVQLGRAEFGQTILVHGGGGGIGTMSILLSKMLGFKITVTTGSDEKAAKCENLGAESINYRSAPWHEQTQKKFDIILDCIGANYLKSNLNHLNKDGKLILIGLLGGRKAEIDLATVLSKRIQIIGSTLRSLHPDQKTALIDDLQRNLSETISNGNFTPPVDSVLPFSEAHDAHQRMAASQHFGKIVLTWKTC